MTDQLIVYPEPCTTCGHSQIVHFMSKGDCAYWCTCKRFTSPTQPTKGAENDTRKE